MIDTKHTPRNTQPVGETALSFSVEGRWAHFRHVSTTEMKHTYRVIPRTTVEGLIAALMGWGRDSYYEYFTPEEAAIAISPGPMLPTTEDSSLTTKQIAQNDIAAQEGDLTDLDGDDRIDRVIDPESVQDQPKRRLYEYVRNPEYRIFLSLEDEDRQAAIHDQLANNRATYSPSLGRSECTCSVTYHGQQELEAAPEDAAVNSTLRVDDTVVSSECELERTPYHMQSVSGGRQTTGFYQYAFSTDGPIESASGTPLAQWDDITLQFH